MLGTQKSLKNIKKYLEGKAGSSMLSMKVLRYVLAVGFVLAPWLGGEAYANTPVGNIVLKDGTGNQIDSGTANIYVDKNKISNGVGLNEFTHFVVGEGQYANIHFATDANGSNPLHTVVNTVQNQIGIYGTVNAIRNGQIGGNLYFISPSGMVVGSGGVINAGSLTAMTTAISDITDAAKAAVAINSTNRRLVSGASINIQGQINTTSGIDLRSLSIAISKNSDSDIKPYLKTGMLFKTIVNTGSPDTYAVDSRLTASAEINEEIKLSAYKYINNEERDIGSITLSECDVDAIGGIKILGGTGVDINNGANIRSKNNIKIDLEHTDAADNYTSALDFGRGTIQADGIVDIRVGGTINIGSNALINSNIIDVADNDDNATHPKVTLMTSAGNITNNGEIKVKTSLDITAGANRGSDNASITNSGTIEATGGGMSFTADRSLTNNGMIQAGDEIAFRVGGTLTNRGTIQSTSSNVQAHIGRDFKNIAVPTNTSDISNLTGGIIRAGGNVQVDHTLPSGMTAVNTGSAIDGISNSGLIWAKGDVDPTYDAEGNIENEGSGNIWLTSNYNITNRGTMKAGRQITLNARDFLDNYGTIEGVTYLDIKSIMGYVYNHGPYKDGTEMKPAGRIIATGGNIALSSGQENLSFIGNNGQITLEEQEAKKELYRKFTPIIIKGSVEATSDDNNANQTKEGKIEITAHLGDIYINGGTIKTKPKRGENNEVVAKAGDVILDAAQNITIGFKTEYAEADDPTTDNKYGDHPEYDSNTERGYYKPILDSNLVPSSPCDEPSTISGTNVTLSAGSINNKHALIGGNLTLDPKTKVKLEGSLTLQGNNMTVSGVQRSDNSSGSLQVVANGVGGTDSAINSLNLNIEDNLLFDKLNVNTADITISGDLQINKLHVADLAHFTSNNTVVGVYGGSTTPTNDQSDALFRDLGNGSTTWMGLNISNGSYSVTNSTQISNSVENLAQMSAKLVDYTPQDSYNERYGDMAGCFERYDIIEAPNRPTGGIAPTAESSGAELKQDENGLHIEMKNNNFEHEMDQRREQDKREGEKEA